MATKKCLIKILTVGKAESGKTCLANRYVFPDKELRVEYKPTIGADFFTIEIEYNEEEVPVILILQVWDAAGQEKFTLGNAFCRGADAAIVVYDINDENAFEGVEKWRKNVLSSAGSANIAMMLVANKCDLICGNIFANAYVQQHGLQNGIKLLISGYCRNVATKFDLQIPSAITNLCMSYSDCIKDGQNYASENNMEFLYSSAKDGRNVKKIFNDIAIKAYKQWEAENKWFCD